MTSGPELSLLTPPLLPDVKAGCDVTGVSDDVVAEGAVSSLTSIGELVVGDSRPLSLALSTTAAARSAQNDKKTVSIKCETDLVVLLNV